MVSAETRRGAGTGYRDLFLHMMDGFAVQEILLAPDGRPCDFKFLEVNPAFERLTGLSASAVIGRTGLQVFPQGEPEWLKWFGPVAMGGGPVRFEQHSADLSRTFEMTAYCLSPLYFACIFKDITEKRNSEETHRLDEARLESLVRIAQHRSGNGDDLLEHTLQEAIRLTSSRFGYINIYDDAHETFLTSIWSGELARECRIRDPHAAHQLRDAGLWAEAVRQRRPVIINDYTTHDTGTHGLPEGHAPLSTLLSVPVFRDERLVAVIGVANKPAHYDDADARQVALLMDSAWKIAEVTRAEESLRRSESKLRALFAAMTDIVMVIDNEGRIREIAPGGAAERWGDPSELVGVPLARAFPREVAEALHSHVLCALDGRQPRTGEYRAVVGGTERWYSFVMSPMTVATVIMVARDVTDRRRAEERNRFQAQLLQMVRHAVIATDLERRVIFWNRAAAELYGWLEEEAIGRLVASLVGTPETGTVGPFALALQDTSSWTGEILVQDKAGREFPALISLAPILGEDGVPVGLVSITSDNSGRRMAEEALRQSEERFQQAQKMEAVGRLAGGIAHDFNNILTVIGGYCDVASEAAESGSTVAPALAEIRTSTRRAAALTAQLLTFSRRQILQVKRINPADLVRGMDGMLRRLLGEDIELSVVGPAETGSVRADWGKLEQVIMNLAVNARDAMPNGGSLTIETANVILDRDYVRMHSEVREGEYVLLAVSDTGIGMDAATRRRLFEPFFTTKEAGKGTGLGLATVYGIVRQSEGHIFCYSEPGTGTTFKIYLPRVEEDRVDDRPAPAALPREPGHGERILLVEDDEALRTLTGTILGQAGYTVLAASTGKEAMHALQSPESRVDLLITDVVLPSMDGRSLSREVTGRFPEARVLFMSGYTENGITHQGIVDEGIEFLQKPFTSAVLLGRVRGILGTAPRPGA